MEWVKKLNMKTIDRHPKEKTADTLCIIKTPKSSYWYVQFYVSKSFSKSGYYVESTKEKDKRKAWHRAKDIHRYFDKDFNIKNEIINHNAFNQFVYDFYDKEIEDYKKMYPEENYKEQKWWYKKNRWLTQIQRHFENINFKNRGEFERAANNCMKRLKSSGGKNNQGLDYETVEKYKTDISMMCKYAQAEGLIQFIPIIKIPEDHIIKDKTRDHFYHYELEKVRNSFLEDYKKTGDRFIDELVDYIQLLRSSPFRPGKETSNIRFGHCYLNQDNPKRPIINIVMPRTKTSRKKKKIHHQSCHPLFTKSTFVDRMMNRYPDMKPDDFLFFPHLKTPRQREALDQRIRKTFKRKLEELGLYYSKNGKPRTLYLIRHSVVIQLSNAGASISDLAQMANTDSKMIVNHYLAPQTSKDGSILNERVFKNFKPRD